MYGFFDILWDLIITNERLILWKILYLNVSLKPIKQRSKLCNTHFPQVQELTIISTLLKILFPVQCIRSLTMLNTDEEASQIAFAFLNVDDEEREKEELREVLTTPVRTKIEKEAEKDVDFTGKNILLVEDNELNQEIASEILREAGFIVDVAEDGIVAVEKMASAAYDRYDLILMDIQMPKMNGFVAKPINIKELMNTLADILR